MSVVVHLNSAGRVPKTFFAVPGDTPFAIAVKGNAFSRQRLASEPLGGVVLTFSGIKAGSELWIMDQNRNVLGGMNSTGLNPSVTLNYYAAGSANNNVRILIIALGYEVLDLSYTLQGVNSTIPVFQRIDRTYNNPA